MVLKKTNASPKAAVGIHFRIQIQSVSHGVITVMTTIMCRLAVWHQNAKSGPWIYPNEKISQLVYVSEKETNIY